MLRLLAIPAVLIALTSASLWWSATAEPPRADFTFINRGEIGTLDPNRMAWLQDIRVGYALWEGLYTLNPQTLDAEPGAAGEITVSDDQTIYRFGIRPDARWSNGDDLVAADFAFAWRRMLEEPGDYTYLLHYIRGAREYQEAFAAGKRPSFAEVGIVPSPSDPKVLTVTLKHPVGFFPDICAFPPLFPLHEKSMRQFIESTDEKTGRVTYSKRFTRPGLVTNGPYRLAAWEFKRVLRLEASEHYWDRRNVRSRIIDMVSTEDPLVAFQKYETGRVDWVAEVAGEIAAELKDKGRKDLHVFPGFGTYFYSFNCQEKLHDGRKNPFADVRVRQALTMALDRAPIVEQITRMGEEPAVHYIPPTAFTKYQSPAGLPSDVVKARALLAEAGYPGGRGFPNVELLYNAEAHHGEVAQHAARQWEEKLGVKMTLAGREIKVFREMLHGKKYAVARASWIGDYNDPSTFTDKYLSHSENNDSAWANPEYDRLAEGAVRESDEAKRMAMFAAAEEILLEEAPILPVYHYVNVYLFRDEHTGPGPGGRRVGGLPLNPRNMVMFKSVGTTE